MPTILKVVALNGTLNPSDQDSATSALLNKLLVAMSQTHFVQEEVIRLRDFQIPPIATGEPAPTSNDDWPMINDKIKGCDILLIATPIWWGNRSSLTQRAIERMDASTDSAGYGDFGGVAGVVVQGDEDGGQAVQAGIMEVLTYMGFTLPPFCGIYDLHQPSMEAGLEGWLEKTAQSLITAALRIKGNSNGGTPTQTT